MDEPKKQQNIIFLHEKFASIVIKDCATQESIKFKTKLGFNVNDIFNTNEQTVSEEITDAFKK